MTTSGSATDDDEDIIDRHHNNNNTTTMMMTPNERGLFAECYGLLSSQGLSVLDMPNEEVMDDTLTRVQLGRYDPRTSISVIFEMDEGSNFDNDHDESSPSSDPDLDPDLDLDHHDNHRQQQGQTRTKYAHFQFVTRFMDPQNGIDLITRVSTQRIPITKDESTFLQSLNDEVIPVILAKEAAYRSMVSQEEDDDGYLNLVVQQDHVEQYASNSRRDLDATVHAISKAYRSRRMVEGYVYGRHFFCMLGIPSHLVSTNKRSYNLIVGMGMRRIQNHLNTPFLQNCASQ